jgi:hypothetical protein
MLHMTDWQHWLISRHKFIYEFDVDIGFIIDISNAEQPGHRFPDRAVLADEQA